MTEKMIEDELEATSLIGNGEICIACLCLGLSLLCGLLWCCSLIVPQFLNSFKAI